MRNRIALATAFSMMLPTSGTVFSAAHEKEEGGMMKESDMSGFNKLDKDGNESLTKMEAMQHKMLDEKFSEADKDGNGAIDRAEFSAFEAMTGKSGKKAY